MTAVVRGADAPPQMSRKKRIFNGMKDVRGDEGLGNAVVAGVVPTVITVAGLPKLMLCVAMLEGVVCGPMSGGGSTDVPTDRSTGVPVS